MNEPSFQLGPERLQAGLKRFFGYDTFRPNQIEIIEATLAGRDVFAVMPTGGGKSLCYQLPACLRQGTTVVVSPLISLMKDQVDAAVANGIQAALLNSSLDPQSRAAVYRRLADGALDLLYVAPERFGTSGFIDCLTSASIDLVAIDEAHCISEWGHDFRPDYLEMGRLREWLPRVPMAAFTATATSRVQDQILERLNLRAPLVVRASFDRPNLFYAVTPKEKVDHQILAYVRQRPGQAGIVYRTTRDSVDRTALHLMEHDIRALPYHAGLEQHVRARHQEAFNHDQVDVVVATIAFGMGIDKANVRFVVHGDLPKNIEGYYQETGRAGRDDDPAHCQLFFSPGDIPRQRYFIDQMEDEQERAVAQHHLRAMARYASLPVCRRKQLLGYFGEAYGDDCGTCDICTSELDTRNASTDAQILLSAIARTSQRFGAGHITDLVIGANTRRLRELGHTRLKTYGAGAQHPKGYWRDLLNELMAREYLTQSDGRYPVLGITDSGWAVLRHGQQVMVTTARPSSPRPEAPGRTARDGQTKKARAGQTKKARDGQAQQTQTSQAQQTQTSQARRAGLELDDSQQSLFDQLRTLRTSIARTKHIPPYMVFSDRSLKEMCRQRPGSPEELLAVPGVGESKLASYGERFLRVIAECGLSC